MGFILDIILILAFVFSVVIAYKKGLLRSLVDAFGLIASIVFASKVSEYIHILIYENFFKERIVESVKQEIVATVTNGTVGNLGTSFLETRKFLSGFASLVGFDKESISEEITSIDFSAENAAEVLTEVAIQPVLTAAIKCVTFFVLAVVFIIGLIILSRFLTKILKKTPLNGINKFFGGVFGVLKGLIIVAMLTVLVVLLASVIENESFDTMVSSSKIFELLNTQSNIFKIN